MTAEFIMMPPLVQELRYCTVKCRRLKSGMLVKEMPHLLMIWTQSLTFMGLIPTEDIGFSIYIILPATLWP
jgi:hypothetical protein